MQAHIDAGAGETAEDVLRAGIEALEAQEAAKLSAVREKISRALNDPRPSVPANDAFARAEALIDAIAKK